MQRSIATVSLSGTLPEKLEAIAAAGFDASRFSKTTCCITTVAHATSGSYAPTWVSPSPCSSHFAILKVAVATDCNAMWTAPNANST